MSWPYAAEVYAAYARECVAGGILGPQSRFGYELLYNYDWSVLSPHTYEKKKKKKKKHTYESAVVKGLWPCCAGMFSSGRL